MKIFITGALEFIDFHLVLKFIKNKKNMDIKII